MNEKGVSYTLFVNLVAVTINLFYSIYLFIYLKVTLSFSHKYILGNFFLHYLLAL